MSTAMMSAPSWASRTACDRPCPRAAPVMKATLPSSFPATFVIPFTSVTNIRVPGPEPALAARPGPGQAGVRKPASGFSSQARSGLRPLAMPLDALRVGTVQRQPGEELGRHAPAAARVVGRARPAGAPGLRPAQAAEQLRVPPYRGEPARAADVPGQEALVDRERAREDVAHRVDQADHPAGPAQVQAGQRIAVAGQVEERVAGQHLLAARG